MKINYEILNTKVGRGNVFKPKIGNESLQQVINDTGVRILNLHVKKSRFKA